MTKSFYTSHTNKIVFSDMCGRNMEIMQKTDWFGYSYEGRIELGLVNTNCLKRQIKILVSQHSKSLFHQV